LFSVSCNKLVCLSVLCFLVVRVSRCCCCCCCCCCYCCCCYALQLYFVHLVYYSFLRTSPNLYCFFKLAKQKYDCMKCFIFCDLIRVKNSISTNKPTHVNSLIFVLLVRVFAHILYSFAGAFSLNVMWSVL